MSLSFIDLFAGVGGTRLAFESQGMDCVFSSEWDIQAQRVYEANFHVRPHGDITEISARSIPKFDILVAGFPCQPFSSIGLGQGFAHETQGTLFFEICRILDEKKPKAFLLENVVGLINNDRGRTFKLIQDSLLDLGYKLHFRVLDSSHFGVPQKRRRVYIVGFRTKASSIKFEFPEPNFEGADFSPFIEWGAEGYEISEHLQSSYIFKIDDGRPQVLERDWEGPINTLLSSYYKVQRLTGTYVRDGRTGLRLLSRNESLAAMGFPADFLLPTSRMRVYKLLGNSVAVPVVAEIAKKIKIALTSSS